MDRPNKAWAVIEIVIGASIAFGGIVGWIPFSSNPWMLLAATILLWWRGPGWRGVGLRRPSHWGRTILLGLVVGLGYQLVGTYVIERVIARFTGELPDVSMFRGIIGNEWQLAFWLTMSWTLAAFMEEMVYRGWLMNRIAELTDFSRAGWIVAVIAISAFFGAIHLYQGFSGVLATGLSGLVFGWLYLATDRNLWACILAHGFLDTAGFMMMYFGIYPGI